MCEVFMLRRLVGKRVNCADGPRQFQAEFKPSTFSLPVHATIPGQPFTTAADRARDWPA